MGNSRYYKATATGELQDAQRVLTNHIVLTTSKTLTVADSGGEYAVATDALVHELPAIDAGNIGMEVTFFNTGADGAVALTISPASTDGINGTIANAAADSVASGVVNKNIVNTKATANNMDYIKLKATALTKWTIMGGVGIWASEA